MESLISLLVIIIVGCFFAYGAWWICTYFRAPLPVFWLVGLILLVMLLYFVAGTFNFHFHRI